MCIDWKKRAPVIRLEYFDGDRVSVVEWSQLLLKATSGYLTIHFNKDVSDDQVRTLVLVHGATTEALVRTSFATSVIDIRPAQAAQCAGLFIFKAVAKEHGMLRYQWVATLAPLFTDF